MFGAVCSNTPIRCTFAGVWASVNGASIRRWSPPPAQRQ
jgi:hypothetical protein